ncbi:MULTISPECIES: anthranilate phosphoribosyltransferase [unclassified Marinobacterium]|uniref:anthranilate phosphoribosyltransferase n=1 Tax=unclassified Marinobacterium TaxID=2644139 RepID=UPI00156A3669|nr:MULTISPECIES: anthranilate phosphoribosyltransferase [unclassified Marinobacterium]NRP57388.1 Anthranilate phosphoribosyltransferase [Marinobacterium sp. xm-d-510]NRP97900.1 Anthranilate phosphoribosyltransferase [Marinobacterium sp. xm-a-127]
MDIKEALALVVAGHHLSRDEMTAAMRQIMTGEATDAQIGAFLTALRIKGETVEEITAAADVMRSLAVPVSVTDPQAVDIVGTGGDGSNLFNVSSATSFVVAAAGGTVAKHGNRSVSSKSGAADLLEAAGIHLALNPEQVARCIDEVGVGFMFAPQHHSAMKHAIGPRRELAMRTLFNVLGPLTNPAGAKHYLMGVFDESLCRPMAEALRSLGAVHALVVHSNDGLDEISLATTTQVAELKDGEVTEYEITAESAGLEAQTLEGLQVADANESLALIRAAMSGANPKAADMVALNAGAALYAADKVESLKAGVQLAVETIASGAALAKMEELARFSQAFKEA